MKIPFIKNFIAGREMEYIKAAVEANHLQGDGRFAAECNALLEKITGARCALIVSSCTSGLELAALLADVKPRDEVIVPSFTFVSTASAFALRGAKIKWCDIREDTLNMDEQFLKGIASESTKIIAPVHYAGVVCDMASIMETAQKHSSLVIEDAAQGMMSYLDGRHAGSFGQMASLSFHGTKNVVCGEGGAILINDERFIDRAYILREKGTNRRQFINGQVDKYTWVDLGGSFVASEIAAAFLLGQLEHAEEITKARLEVCAAYRRALEPLEAAGRFKLGRVPEGCRENGHIFYMLMNTPDDASKMLSLLKGAGIGACQHYAPLHLSPMGIKLAGGNPVRLPVSESVAKRIVRLPVYPQMTPAEIDYVVGEVEKF